MTTAQIRLVPAYKKTFKITLYLHPAEYTALMRASAELSGGKLSMHKFFKTVTGIQNARAEAKEGQNIRAMAQHLRHWGTVPSQLEQRREAAKAKGKGSPKRNSPRKMAA